jgi:hypothetical protein
MEERQAPGTVKDVSTSAKWLDLWAILVLAAVATGIRTWQITHTEVTSRDSIGFIRIAWRLENENWFEVIPHSAQHPGFPLTVLLMSAPVRWFMSGDLATIMQMSAQLAGALASVLLVLPMYLLGRELFDRRVGFWATLMFQCIPASGRVMGDGLSEGLFLLCASTFLLGVARGLRGPSAGNFVLAGLAGGLAYLTRPEGAMLLAAAGVVLVCLQIVPRGRMPWRQWLRISASLFVTAAVLMGPFMVLIRGLTVKNSANFLLQSPVGDAPAKTWQHGALAPRNHEEQQLAMAGHGLPLAVWLVDGVDPGPKGRTLWAVKAFRGTLVKLFFYVAWVPALVGLVWGRLRPGSLPAFWIFLLVNLFLLGALFRIAAVMGYISERHMLLLSLTSSYWVVAGTGVLAAILVAPWKWLLPRLAERGWFQASLLAQLLLLGYCIPALVRTLEPLHADRSGFREAGSWLAEHTWLGDQVIDPYTWASYYAGRVFVEGKTGLPAHEPPVQFVVLERSSNKHPHIYSLPEAERLAASGTIIARWPVQRAREAVEVVVYEVKGRAAGISQEPVGRSQESED